MAETARSVSDEGPQSQQHLQHVPQLGVDDLSTTDDFDLGATDDAPPAYGELHDQLQLEQPGFSAGAAVTTDGRVNINISEKNSSLARLLAPAIQNQLTTQPAGPLPPAYIPPSLGGQPGQTPPPQLNVVIQIVGSRGDVQPFVALGQVLKDTYGHRVRLATHATFQKFVEENGLEFFSIGGDPAELMAFMVKNPGLMPGLDALKSGEISKRRQGIEQILLGCWRSCIEAGDGTGPPPLRHKTDEPVDETYSLPGNPNQRPFVADAIIANPPSFAHVHIAEKLGIPLHMMFTMPWSPTRAFPHPLANIESTNTDVVMTNYMSYALVEMMTWQGLGDVINRFRTKILDLDPLSLIWAPGLLSRLRIPTTYCWSPALIPKPADWANEVTIAGFYFLNLASSYTPDPELAAFLDAGPPPVYIGFGSIVVDDPNSLTRMIFDAVAASGVRALVSQGWGGLGVDSVGKPDGVFMLGNVPHDWLFKRVSAVVHHGGAGTSAAGINAGKPTVVVPFFGDQPFWGSMIARAGAGPAPIPFAKLTAENLAAAITEAVKPETQARAEELGAKIREEQGADVGGKSFHQFLNTRNMRCSIAPSRVATWRVRRTKTRLSPLAAAVLVKEGELKYSDLKLYRSHEYSTEDQPWDPISAAACALVGDLSSLTMAVADLPREMFRSGARSRARSGTATTEVGPNESSSRTDETASVMSGGAAPSNASTTQLPGTQSETASLLSSGPSVVVSAPGQDERPETAPEEESPSSERTPIPSSGSTDRLDRSTPSLASPKRTDKQREVSPAAQVSFDTVLGAGRGASRIVATGVKTPMNFCLGIARGFRNVPRLYNDDTIRPVEKVTGLGSGLKVAGMEFGLGIYDGISGLVTQPYRGATKEGAAGLIKGFGKGIGGLILKPSAALWSIPAYAMQGVHAEVRNRLSRSSQNYIITSRVIQGQEDFDTSTSQERSDILNRWRAKRDDLKRFYLLKQKEKRLAENPDAATSQEDLDTAAPPRTGWLHTHNLSFEDRKKLQEQKTAWKKRAAEARAGHLRSSSSATSLALEDEEFERAIQESVRQTSRGDTIEDARIEAAIRASVLEMRRIADYARDFKRPIATDDTDWAGSSSASASGSILTPPTTAGGDEDWSITDEEYQSLIEKAVTASLAQDAADARRAYNDDDSSNDEGLLRALEESRGPGNQEGDENEEEELRRALEESRSHERPVGDEHEEEQLLKAIEESKTFEQPALREGQEDEELQRVLEESEKAHREQLARDKTEEEIILEYIKKQSLAEEEIRRSQAKGKAVATNDDGEEERDEDLRRALEESLKMSGQEHAGPSGSRA
ncbi:UDP-Glycosyltransferase/glycogen phosphorylase [Thozetella sp. PMI_491]|nr:UDP-Glycosyltransferase/glycogen phosphorylase [Thozetella sp. PMI_491]